MGSVVVWERERERERERENIRYAYLLGEYWDEKNWYLEQTWGEKKTGKSEEGMEAISRKIARGREI